MREQARDGGERGGSEADHDPLLDGADVPEETPNEDVVPEDVGSEQRSPSSAEPEPPLP